MYSSQWDCSNTHDDNDKLITRDEVIRFYQQLNETVRPDYEFFAWLACLTFDMHKTAIPLFCDGDVHYQIHPSFSNMPLRQSEKIERDDYYFRMMEFPAEGKVLVVPFGRLFINKPFSDPDNPGEVIRLPQWTGYEVFLDIRLNLWFVFRSLSFETRRFGWSPARCDLFGPQADKTAIPDWRRDFDVPTPFKSEDMLDSAPFLSARVTLNGNFTMENLDFGKFKLEVNDTKQTEREIELQVVEREFAANEVSKSPAYERKVPTHISSHGQSTSQDNVQSLSSHSGLPLAC
ncbi:hypothetical protein F5Y10DRAFT_236061 [Nemania abortiva]|nr:hypothetical protein F5Y10DRAFT_236061 [Nemania abortiva]